MPCFFPTPALDDNGKVRLHPPLGTSNLQIPCGKCLGCRVQQSQDWATRIMHECQDHRETKFLTLTYDEDHLPYDLRPEHLSGFIRNLRFHLKDGHEELRGNPRGSVYYRKLRYFAAGEYGEVTQRPHYHMVLFGLGFRDEAPYGSTLYHSAALTKIWGHGAVRYGAVTHQSAAYVAHYTKKQSGVEYVDPTTGECKRAPFSRTSTRPGIGAGYAIRHHLDLRAGGVYTNHQVGRIPRYYRKLLEKHAPLIGEESGQATWVRGMAQDPQSRTAQGLTAKLVALQQRQHARRLQL